MNLNDYGINNTKPEIIIADEDYMYGSFVKMRIPSMMSFVGGKDEEHELQESMVINKDIMGLDFTTFITTNIMSVKVPDYLVPHHHAPPCDMRGYEGDKFLCIFVGGDIAKPQIIGRT